MTDTPEAIVSPISDELAYLDSLLKQRLHSNLPFIMELSNHIIAAGGKRVRPTMVLLSALACGYQADDDRHIALAMLIEFIHTATLLHDDVVDGSAVRRGRQTVKSLWGNSASVLVGDFLYSRAFQILYEINHPGISQAVADATNLIAEGEVQQLVNLDKKRIAEQEYIEVITHKTAILFQAACYSGALLASNKYANNMANFGLELGLAFQLIDDLLDYQGSANKLCGQDLAEGKLTLPLIHAFEHANASQVATLDAALGNGEAVASVCRVLKATGSLAYTYQKACRHAQRAYKLLEGLSPSLYKISLEALTRFVVERSY